MKIIYVTTTMEQSDYNAFATQWSIPLNSSKQTFNYKLIKALSVDNQIDVISIRPFSRKLCSIYYLDRANKSTNSVKWHYLAIPRYRLFKYPACKSQTLDLLSNMDLENTIVLTETINPIALHVANAIKDAYKLPVIGLVTDSPSNIRNTTKEFSQRIFKMGQRFDGYIAQTKELNTVFNTDNKPNIVMEGIVEDELPPRINNEFGRYVFFGGSLEEKYGIYALIEAFKSIDDKNLRLLMCGHHANNEKLAEAIESDSRIVNLGNLTNKKTIQMEMNALINVEPRPYSEDLDRFLIPNKVLEYMNAESIVVSVKSSKLKKYFEHDVIWAKDGSVASLYEALTKALQLSEEERDTIAKEAKQKVHDLYCQKVIAKNINAFLKTIYKK